MAKYAVLVAVCVAAMVLGLASATGNGLFPVAPRVADDVRPELPSVSMGILTPSSSLPPDVVIGGFGEILTPAGIPGEYPLEQFSMAVYWYAYPPGFGRDPAPTRIGDGTKVAHIDPLSDGARDRVLTFSDLDNDGMLSTSDRFVISDVQIPMCDPACERTWDSYGVVLSYRGYAFVWFVFPVVVIHPPSSLAGR